MGPTFYAFAQKVIGRDRMLRDGEPVGAIVSRYLADIAQTRLHGIREGSGSLMGEDEFWEQVTP